MIILPSHYFGSVEYWARLVAAGDDAVIDVGENYIKRTERNRTTIMTSNSLMQLSVQLAHANRPRQPMRSMRVDYSKRWQHQHNIAIESAYKRSPYYDYYAEAFEPFYSKRWEWLVEYNLEIARTLLRLMGEAKELNISEKYVDATPEDLDLRGKKEFLTATYAENLPTYTQVFEDRMDFVAGASVIDLFFCEGPYAASLLRR